MLCCVCVELVKARCSCDGAQGLNGLKLGEVVVTPEVKHGQNKGSAIRDRPRLRRTYSHVEEVDVVSLEGMTRDVLAQLMTEEEDRLLVVVSIVGMGGIDERELIDKLKENKLMKRLFDVLKEKQYLIVLDDIWRSEDWNSLKPAFPRGKKGSKILITTRNKDVALLADPCISPIEIPLLTDDESWKLFSMKAFPGNKIESHACSREFEMPGREMVKKCGGLPLAIVVLGGLLATKKSRAQWEVVQRNIHAHLNKVQQQDHQYGAVNGVLALSYNDLPYFLKPCFLYLAHYPEDWEISKKELIQLWIAEGFISPSLESKGMLMEDVAEQILEELINRCLVQVSTRDYTTGVKTCRLHDLLRDLCVDIAREENFLEIIQPPLIENYGDSLDVTLSTSMLRRIAIHPRKRVVKRDVRRWIVSSEIGNLHHLRYLGLKCDEGEIILPRSIRKLKSLHTLQIRSGCLAIPPNVLFELERLRHILLIVPEKVHIGIKLICSANGFLQLDSLEIGYLPNLEEWQIEEGAMLRLRSLQLMYVPQLRMIPEGLRYITALQEMKLNDMKRSLVERIEVIDGREGEDSSIQISDTKED
ncbi:hypothetical protein CRYUN_Cryun01aG0039700 [Craigia yunnanensis]